MADEQEQAPHREVTRILDAVQAGGAEASSELLPLVYEDLRRLAASRTMRLSPGQSLQATELVHEAYMRLVGSTDPGWQGRAHFFGAAARAMRNVVVDHLRRKGRLKRGGDCRRLGEATFAGLTREGPDDDVLALEETLALFELEYPRKAEVVTLRFYGNLTAKEIAEVMGVTSRTVERDWRFAKAWLNGRLAEGENAP